MTLTPGIVLTTAASAQPITTDAHVLKTFADLAANTDASVAADESESGAAAIDDLTNTGDATGTTDAPDTADTTGAADTTDTTDDGSTPPATDTDTGTDTTTPPSAPDTDTPTATGALRIEFTSVLNPSLDGVSMTASMSALDASTGASSGITLTVEQAASNASEAASDASESAASLRLAGSFDALAAGEYTLTVSGEDYETYTQQITVRAGISATMRLTDSVSTGMALGEDDYGLMPYGDFNHDGVMNADDAALIAAAATNGTDEMRYDMNNDNATDLRDVQLFAVTVNAERTAAKLAERVDATQMGADVAQNTQVESGSVESLLTGDGSVALKPADGGDISADNPVEITIDTKNTEMEGFAVHPPARSDNKPTVGTITVETADGETLEIPFDVNATAGASAKANASAKAAKAARIVITPAVSYDSDGTVVVSLGTQVAIKKITIRVSETGSNKLADIAEVEFLNDMEGRIPAPELNVPGSLKAEAASQSFTLTWDAQTNVTGYEVRIGDGKASEIVATAVNSLAVTSFNGGKLTNKTEYTVEVRSVNGEWTSPWSDPITVTPVATAAPDAPENVTVTGSYRAIDISWKAMDDAEWYTLYWQADGDAEFQRVDNITANKYTLSGLKDSTTYKVYLTSSNEVGTSGASKTYTGTTVVRDVKVPWYNLINRTVQDASLASHITSVTTTPVKTDQYPADAPFDPMMVVDGDYDTYFYSNWGAQFAGPTVTFDQEYTMDAVALTTYLGDGYGSLNKKTITVTDEAGNKTTYESTAGQVATSSVSGAKNTVMLTFPKSQVKTITVQVTRYYSNPVTISELAFYEYSPLLDDVNGLWADDEHTTLRDDVDQAAIDALRDRANTTDPACDEYHTKRSLILSELDNAEKVLNQEGLRAAVSIDTGVSAKYGAPVGGLNAWQPLGVTAKAGDQLIVYVGGSNKTAGSNSDLSLIATQWHAESGTWNKTVVSTLKVGMNEVTVPKIASLDAEQGGLLYVQYTGSSRSQQYAARVVGGTDVPVLDLHGVSDAAERLALVETYVAALDEHVAALEDAHEHAEHSGDYDAKNCIGNATDIVIDYLMYSIPASQVLDALGSGSVADRAATLLASLDSGDDMMRLFYQHKGLGTLTADEQQTYGTANALPTTRQNIRYMRMFAGAFMYAGGLHIGIEWNETKNLATSSGVVADENGKYVSGGYFGWGIGHEIGHEINQSQYAIAEITNNYFAQLAQAKDSDDSVRFTYDDVYAKVTSGTKGTASSVFTQLAMYWQLHLAYDDGYNYKTYDTYTEQFDNLFFARVDAYARNTKIAPVPEVGEGETPVALTLDGDTDNNLMRLAVAAAERNILPFFEAWGKTPDETTIAYAAQFPAEDRAIQYVTDNARVYRIEGGASVAGSTTVDATLDHEKHSAQVTLNLTASGEGAADGLLGYEIARNGQVVGFVPADSPTFTDTIATINNRVFTYSVTGVDKTLARTATTTLDPVKISTDGSIAKDGWAASTTMISEEDGGAVNPHDPPATQAIDKVVDGDATTVYDGALASDSKEKAQVTLSFGDTLAVTALRYEAGADAANPISEYTVETSLDGVSWQTVKTGTFDLDESGAATVYFNKDDDGWLYTYDAAWLRLTATAQKAVTIGELSVLGATGDDVELVDGGIGYLKSDLVLDESTGDMIPAGSLVFTGAYKGNPAYNAVKLWDQDGNLIAGTQVFFATPPDHGDLGETADGIWVYYIEPADLDGFELPTSVRAELYRVDDAHTLQGERLVADTLPVQLPADLPTIDITR